MVDNDHDVFRRLLSYHEDPLLLHEIPVETRRKEASEFIHRRDFSQVIVVAICGLDEGKNVSVLVDLLISLAHGDQLVSDALVRCLAKKAYPIPPEEPFDYDGNYLAG